MTNPTDTNPSLDPIEAQIRATLQAAAPVDTRVDEGLADLESRLVGDLALTSSDEGHHLARRRLLLAAAAVVVVVAAVAGALLMSGDGGDEGTSIATEPPTTPTALEVPDSRAEPTAPEATTTSPPVAASETGFYVPVDLPDGWTVQSVGTDIRNGDGSVAVGTGQVPEDPVKVLSVVLLNPAGEPVSYTLAAPGTGRTYDSMASPEEYRAEGQVAALDRYRLDGPDGQVLHRFTGSWPNADIVIGDDSGVAPVATPSEDDLILLASTLRPVSTTEWQQFLDQALLAVDVASSATLADALS